MLLHNYTSSAKVNLGLQILNKREDGYHNLHSLFIEIDLADELIFTPSDEFHLTIEGKEGAEISLDESNLITKSYRLFQSIMKNVSTEYAIHLKKIIPIGSGLGGGSSNAAAVLRVLNKLWKINFSPSKLEKIGKELGADIPFFIRGGFQLAEGIGEKLTPQDDHVLRGGLRASPEFAAAVGSFWYLLDALGD